jgi:hypothetical protein
LTLYTKAVRAGFAALGLALVIIFIWISAMGAAWIADGLSQWLLS